jgi:serine/threonine protein kinase
MARKPPNDEEIQFDLKRLDSNVDFYKQIQLRLKKRGEEFSTWAQAHWGKNISNFLDSGLGIEGVSESWEPIRGLGRGGFGLVGLWEKRNSKGELEDEIAVKETEFQKPKYRLKRDKRLPKEAVLMKQLNDNEQDAPIKHILRLRGFKNFPRAEKWRFYLEFAPHGELFRLMYNYRAWDTYLPEEFLWFVFCSLAHVAIQMENGPFTDLETNKPTERSIVHFDIKPANILLGRPDEASMFTNYPTIKVSDFGLSEQTGSDDLRNPSQFWGNGTSDYLPPVSIVIQFKPCRC